MKYQDLIDKLKENQPTRGIPYTTLVGTEKRKGVLSPRLRELMNKYSSPAKRETLQLSALEFPYSQYGSMAGKIDYNSKLKDPNKYSSAVPDSKLPVGRPSDSRSALKRHTIDAQSPGMKSMRCSGMFKQKSNRVDYRSSGYFNGKEFMRTASQAKDNDGLEENPFRQQTRSWITERLVSNPTPEFKENKENEVVRADKKRFSQVEQPVSRKLFSPDQPIETTAVRKPSTFREAAKLVATVESDSEQLSNISSTLQSTHSRQSDSDYQSQQFKRSSVRDNLLPKPIYRSDFEIGKCKGDGKFGRVYPCRHRETGTLYALKEIPKELLSRHMMEDQMLREVKLHSFFNHSNIVKLYGFFNDTLHIYLLMEYMQDGTLYSLLKAKKKLPEEFVAEKMREICSAVTYLHGLGVAHRDIKLENIVLSNVQMLLSQGVAKLCDFGWAAMTDCRRTTYCGTFDYVPPEILEGKDYNEKVDLWSIGVLTYELIAGKVPFYHISRSETINNIINVDTRGIKYPEEMSLEAKDFIGKLLRKNPVERLASELLLSHPFLRTKEHRE